jgi:molybdate transport system substrate-binding protein
MRRSWFGWVLALALACSASARADEISVAVAANFVGTLQKLAPSFEQASGHKLNLSAGSTGQLYAQIKAGAPYEVLLSADAERALALEKEGLSVPGTRFVYARGKLALWSKQPGLVDAHGALLKREQFAKLAIADPRIAPYGAAAQSVLKKLGLWDKLNAKGKIVLGTNVAHAFQFAQSGAANCAFVAYAQVLEAREGGSSWLVPENLYPALNQEVVLLKGGTNKPGARAFIEWLKNDRKALEAVRAAGYGVERVVAAQRPGTAREKTAR